MMSRVCSFFAILLLGTIAVAACAGDGDEPSGADEEWGMEGPLEPTPPPGKEDSENRRGLRVNTDTTRTQVWSAKNKWEDRDTAADRSEEHTSELQSQSN